eukprot:240330-Pelagomonas_calceolata.AAC.12
MDVRTAGGTENKNVTLTTQSNSNDKAHGTQSNSEDKAHLPKLISFGAIYGIMLRARLAACSQGA